MKFSTLFAAVSLFALSACGGGNQSQAENTADQLEQAAEQSDPAAAGVLEDAADTVREQEGNGAAGATAQEALQQAGHAQATTLPTQAPPSVQAQPNRTGQQTPPPKVPTGPGATGNSQ